MTISQISLSLHSLRTLSLRASEDLKVIFQNQEPVKSTLQHMCVGDAEEKPQYFPFKMSPPDF